MKTLKVTTASGGVYIIQDASAFGADAVIGRTECGGELRIFSFHDTDVVEEMS